MKKKEQSTGVTQRSARPEAPKISQPEISRPQKFQDKPGTRPGSQIYKIELFQMKRTE